MAHGSWRLTVAQRNGATLEQSGAMALAFKTSAGWMRATRVRSSRRDGRTLRLEVATTDPSGRAFSIALARAGSGVIALRAGVVGRRAPAIDAVRIRFAAPAGERYYGFGERADSVDHRGRSVEDYVSDGPFSADSRPVTSATIPPAGFRARDDATYYPVPWMLSSRGYGVLVDSDQTSTFDLGRERQGRWDVQVAAPVLALRFFAGPTPAGALARFTEATGRQPAAPAAWAYGPWLQTGQPNAPPLADQVADLDKLRRADAPVSAAETQLRYLPCGLDRGLEDYEARRVSYYHRMGLAVLTYVNPMLCASYEPLHRQALAAGALQRTTLGAPAQFDSFVGGTGPAGFTIQPVGQFDFSRPAGVRAYAGVLRRLVATGHDGWMEDFGEYTPLDAVGAGGMTGTALHDTYPRSYHCAAARIVRGMRTRPIVRFQRSGWTGAARCAVDVWGGDPTTTFSFDGLRSAVRSALGMGLSGVSRWGSDIGGYDTIGNDPKLTPELLARWIEFGAVSGVMRIKKSGLAIPGYQRPQIWDPEMIGTWRRYAKLHTALYPYLAAADEAYRRTGLPLMRALVLGYPGDRRAGASEDEFGFGPDLLAAPVVSEGARSRAVYLPNGRWLDARRSLSYDARRDGAFHVAGALALRGGRTVPAAAALDELPLYIRAGAVLPMLPADVSTLSDYGSGVVRLRDRRGELRLLAFPHGDTNARMFASERIQSRARPGQWRLRILGRRVRRYRLEASTADLRGANGGGFRPCRLSDGGHVVARRAWRYDRRRRVLIATFQARRATLTVSACR